MPILFEQPTGGRPDFVLHPTDLSQASERAFHHALALAVRGGAQFTLLHSIGRRATDNWPGFPSVRSKLAEWKASGGLADVGRSGRRSSVSKVEMEIRDPVAAALDYLERHAVDTIVVATADRSGLSRLLRASRAERLARESKLFTLFVPEGGRYFVDADSGAVELRRILVPVDPRVDARPAMLRAVSLAALMDDPSVEITLLHVDDGRDAVVHDLPDLPFCRWNAVRRSGDSAEEILRLARELEADAVYMSTRWSRTGLGRDGGNVTERVIEAALGPVGAVPVDAG